MIISHRGNLNGSNPDTENNPDHIISIMRKYPWLHVEIDFWESYGSSYLGHDAPQYLIKPENINFINSARVWIHAKNGGGLDSLRRANFELDDHVKFNYFWHDMDEYAITLPSTYLWVCPWHILLTNSICVLPELAPNIYSIKDLKNAAGICTDYPLIMRELIDNRDTNNDSNRFDIKDFI